MIASTPNQIKTLFAGSTLTVGQVESILNAMVEALNAGMILDSGDGFRFSLKRKYGNLFCQDGSELKSSLLAGMATRVWGAKKTVELFEEIAACGLQDAEELREEMVLTGFAIA